MATLEELHLVEPKDSPKMSRIYNALQEGWKNTSRSTQSMLNKKTNVYWGLIGNNVRDIFYSRECELPWVFTDMPYHGRLQIKEAMRWTEEKETYDKSYWRWCYNNLHDTRRLDVPSDRFEQWGIKVKPWQNSGEHIIVAPSSNAMTRYMYGCDATTWAENIKYELKKYTKRPILVRYKPRAAGRSGPDVAKISIEKDLENCHAVITSASLVSVDALKAGVPVFSTAGNYNPAAWCANKDLSMIETPYKYDREQLFYNLAYKQYSIKEMREGLCYEMSRKYLEKDVRN